MQWKAKDGTVSETYTDGATFVPSTFWEEHDMVTDRLVERISDPEVNRDPAAGGFLVAYRVLVQQDQQPLPPENDYGCPVISAADRWGAFTSDTGYGAASKEHDGLPRPAEHIIEHFYQTTTGSRGDAVRVFDRYLRAFHGGSAVSHATYDGDLYVAYDTRKMREFWGCTDERLDTSEPDIIEWKAFVEGEVFAVTVQRTFEHTDGQEDEHEGWEDVDLGWIHGYYGIPAAQQAAEEELEHAVETFRNEDYLKHVARKQRDEHKARVHDVVSAAMAGVDKAFDHVDGAGLSAPSFDYYREAAHGALHEENFPTCSYCGSSLVNEDCPNYGDGPEHAR